MSRVDRNRAIRSVHAISTGCGELHLEHCRGTWLPRIWWVLTSRSWIEVPIFCFAIEHREGLVLFDAGIDPAIKSDPRYIKSVIGRFLLNRIFRLHVDPDDALSRQLAKRGIAPLAVKKVIISHLHFDHVGGIADVPQAELLVSQDEWRCLDEPHPEREWMLREHILLPDAKWCPIAFESTNDPLLAPFGGCHDVMGDGSMILLPTPGHTPGSMSLLLRSAGMKPLLLVADLAYDVDALMEDVVPGTGDAEMLRRSYSKVRTLKQKMPNLAILASHDPVAIDALRDATPDTA
jgi:N-acyl homoserine lactone hydrolase